MKKILVFLAVVTLTACGQATGLAPNSNGTSGGGGSGGTSSGLLKIFVTAANTTGGFGGSAAAAITGLDAACNADANKPSGGGTYKALVGSTVRGVSADWPLQANTSYYRADGTTLIGTTTAGSIFTFPLSASFTATAGLLTWSGLTVAYGLAGSTCLNWTSSANGDGGDLGAPNLTTNGALYSVFSNCDSFTNVRLVCVQQ